MPSGPPVLSLADGDAAGHVRRAAEVLRDGGVVVLPTETVYGAAVLLGHRRALDRLHELPPAQRGKPFVPHLASRDDAAQYLDGPGPMARRMFRKLWPGPVALMFEVSDQRQIEAATALGAARDELYEGGTITLRCPDQPATLEVLQAVGSPVIARRVPEGGTWASGRAGPWMEAVDLVLDGGPPKYSKPSTIVRVRGEQYEIVRTGAMDRRIIERLLRSTFLFVCSGNTCRSPLAEVVARRVLAEKLSVQERELEKRGFHVLSAGALAMGGSPATPAAAEAAADLGLDLSKHRSRQLTIELINQADRIFTMGKSHADIVRTLVPSAQAKTLPLDPSGDVDDPIGSDVAVYRQLAGRLRQLIEQRLGDVE
jgi:protein-tyrosine phosphatase